MEFNDDNFSLTVLEGSISLICMVDFHEMRMHVSVQFADGTVCTFRPWLLPYFQILSLRLSDSFALQEVIPFEIPLQRLLVMLPVLLRLLHLLGIVGHL